jgi:hypothetical protein
MNGEYRKRLRVSNAGGGCLTVRVIFPCGDARFTNQRYRLGGIKVFEIFRTTKPDGTGLGLPLVGQIVSAYRGAVDYFSEPGKGTNI